MNRLGFSAMALACVSLAAPLSADPPEGYEGTFRLGGASVSRGEEVRIPFYVSSDPGTQGFFFSIDFDEESLEFGDRMEHVFQKPDASEWQWAGFRVDNTNAIPGNSGIEEGFISGAGIWSFTERVTLPTDAEVEVAAFSARARPDAALGTTEVKFIDGARQPYGDDTDPNHPRMTNWLNLEGFAVTPETGIAPVVINALLQIVPDISIFVRGDSNGDRAVDIGDPQATLNYLFQAADPLPCLDAADANDDGELNISDAITTLQFLFLGGRPLPAPSGVQGGDPTPDSLDCAR